MLIPNCMKIYILNTSYFKRNRFRRMQITRTSSNLKKLKKRIVTVKLTHNHHTDPQKVLS